MGQVTVFNRMLNPERIDIKVPDITPEIEAAERVHAEAVAERDAARFDFDALNFAFEDPTACRSDGTKFPTEGRAALLVELFNKNRECDAAEQSARANLNELRRAFSERAAIEIEPACDALCEEIRQHIEIAERLLGVYSEVNADAAKRGLSVRHMRLARAAVFVGHLRNLAVLLSPCGAAGKKRA